MARDLTKLGRTEYAGDLKFRRFEVDITSYTTGGEDLTPGDFRLNRFLTIEAENRAADGHYAQYDESAEKLKVFQPGGSELASAGTATITVTAFGK